MMSLTGFKDNLLALFRIMTKPENSGMYIDVTYKDNLYRITVQDMHQHIRRTRPPRQQDLTREIQARRCPSCRKLMLNSVCMNSRCPDNVRLSKV